MTRYAILFSYSADAASSMVKSTSDRTAAVRKLLDAAGGQFVDFYWMLGKYDGLAIVDLPDHQTAASLALAVTSSRGFSRFETYPLFPGDELPAIEDRAREISGGYEPPNR